MTDLIDLDADIFALHVDPPPEDRRSEGPRTFSILSTSFGVFDANPVVRRPDAPHLIRLYERQGEAGSALHGDWEPVISSETRGDTDYRGGISVVLRHGRLREVPGRGRAPDVNVLISAMTETAAPLEQLLPMVKPLRVASYAFNSLWNEYEIARAHVEMGAGHLDEVAGLRTQIASYEADRNAFAERDAAAQATIAGHLDEVAGLRRQIASYEADRNAFAERDAAAQATFAGPAQTVDELQRLGKGFVDSLRERFRRGLRG